MASLKEKIAYIKDKLSFRIVFNYYGLVWKSDATHQFSCDLHGDGRDRTPSARYYADTKIVKCYACEEGNNGGDVCWYIKKREKLRNYPEVVELIKLRFGISLDENDLAKRIELVHNTPPPDDIREVLRKKMEEEVNNAFFDAKKDVGSFKNSQFQQGQRLVWDELKKLDKFPGSYTDLSASLYAWRDWALKVVSAISNHQIAS